MNGLEEFDVGFEKVLNRMEIDMNNPLTTNYLVDSPFLAEILGRLFAFIG